MVDGDTFTALVRGKQLKCRMQYIDAPESKQPGGPDSTAHLRRFLYGRQFVITSVGKDMYGRTLATVRIGKVGINLRMVRDGHAWAYRAKKGPYADAQRLAESRKVGLWSQPTPEAPWDYRRRIKHVK